MAQTKQENNKLYYERHKEKEIARIRKWEKENPEKRKEYTKKYYQSEQGKAKKREQRKRLRERKKQIAIAKFWEVVKANNSLEDFYNMLCRNRPHKNSKKYKEWDLLESLAYEKLLNDNEDTQECDKIIDNIIEYLKNEKLEVLKKYE